MQLIQLHQRVEAQLDYNFELGGLGGHLWVDGSYQNLGKTKQLLKI